MASLRAARGEHAASERLRDVVGGPARLHVVLVLACVLALNTADQATVGAAGSEIERGLGIDNTLLGLLAAVTPLMGALGAFPAGILVDRLNRTRLMAGAIVVWSIAMVVSGFALSYPMLLLVRVGLGLVAAIAGPIVASLLGDYFAASERGRIYGMVLSGELLGAAVGFVVSGEVATALSWRWSFGILAIPGLALAVWIVRSLPEPARGGRSRLAEGDTEIVDAEHAEAAGPQGEAGGAAARTDPLAERAVSRQHIPPRGREVLHRDPASLRPLQAIRYVLSIPSNRLLIVASTLSYFFLEGLQTFAVIFLQRRYGIAHSLATLLLGAIVIIAVLGAVFGGRIADAWLARGRVDARILVSSLAFLLAGVFLIPAFALPSLGAGLVFYFIAALGIAAPNPPLDAARLDIMPSGLWGRAEGVRAVLRNFGQSFAPFLFGFVSDRFAPPAAAGTATGFGAGASGTGLEDTFLVMLAPLLIASFIMFMVRRPYPRDVATALESEHAIDRAAHKVS
ncbi:MAG TPA: MFS transporter [Solirubrobacteraceae bacterium]|nr:MFS transporter [Solirubrobacteraceae bacterium]